jgi:lipopolysaccharide/colanic/teichoic acid biosynthesis glycosyltransferase
LVIKVQVINILLGALFFFLLPFGIEPKTNLAIYLVISTLLILLWRLYIFPLIVTGRIMTVLVIGGSEEALAIAHVFGSNPYFQNIHPYQVDSSKVKDFDEFRGEVLRFVENEQVEVIIADMREEFTGKMAKDFYMLAFEDRNISFYNLPTVYEELHRRVPPSLIEENWLLENVTSRSPHYAYEALKRVIDIVGACVFLIPSLIILPFVVLAIKLEDKGPIFYQAERVGRYNTVIKVLKLRTMSGLDDPQKALKSTLLVTKVGKYLRKSRIDELPQLVNVLKGELSFIGPRPEIPTLAHVYAENIPYYNMRHLIKPGLSGWAQINNFDVPRGGVDIERTIDKLSFDLYYLKHRSLLMDIEIALKTVNTLLMRSGT